MPSGAGTPQRALTPHRRKKSARCTRRRHSAKAARYEASEQTGWRSGSTCRRGSTWASPGRWSRRDSWGSDAACRSSIERRSSGGSFEELAVGACAVVAAGRGAGLDPVAVFGDRAGDFDVGDGWRRVGWPDAGRPHARTVTRRSGRTTGCRLPLASGTTAGDLAPQVLAPVIALATHRRRVLRRQVMGAHAAPRRRSGPIISTKVVICDRRETMRPPSLSWRSSPLSFCVGRLLVMISGRHWLYRSLRSR